LDVTTAALAAFAAIVATTTLIAAAGATATRIAARTATATGSAGDFFHGYVARNVHGHDVVRVGIAIDEENSVVSGIEDTDINAIGASTATTSIFNAGNESYGAVIGAATADAFEGAGAGEVHVMINTGSVGVRAANNDISNYGFEVQAIFDIENIPFT
jgi:ribosomal protein S11